MALFPVALFGLAFSTCWGQPDQFQAQAWQAADISAECNARSGMVDDLLAGNELKLGRPREEVERLLGPTEDTDYWLSEQAGLVYVTGCWIDCDWLVIEFDDHARLVKAYTAQD
jgi:hypothetical protein